MRATHAPLCRLLLGSLLGSLLVMPVGCAEDEGLGSEEDARRAYLGLDQSIEKSLDLGMDGFNAASNANIPTQSGEGDVSGTIVIDGQVDQGASDNKGMRLTVTLEGYSDGVIEQVDDEDVEITYDTRPDDLPDLTLTLRDIPNGTLEGTLVGTYDMHGYIEGTATLDLMMSGPIEDDGNGGITRTVGETQITGVAHSGDYTYDVDVRI
jgi:hypothetical protein